MMTCATQSTLGLVQVRHCDGLYESHDVELQLCNVDSGVQFETTPQQLQKAITAAFVAITKGENITKGEKKSCFCLI